VWTLQLLDLSAEAFLRGWQYGLTCICRRTSALLRLRMSKFRQISKPGIEGVRHGWRRMSQQPLRNEQAEGGRDIGAKLLAEQMARLAISYAFLPQPSYQCSVVSFTSLSDVLRRSLTCVYYWHIFRDDKRGDILTTLLNGSP